MLRRSLAAAVLALSLTPAAASAATASPSGAGCDRLDDAACLLPFPNNAFTKADKRTPTGRVVSLRNGQMPRNAKGTPIAAASFKGLDGFSPGSVILTRVPGLTATALKRSGAASLSDISTYARADAPILVLDAKTGRRWPIWAELDANAAKAKDRLLEIHPARNFLEGHRYVVVLRSLGAKASKRFAALRDARRPGTRYTSIFATLRKAKVRRDASLRLAWDFTVASEKGLAGRALSMRDRAFAALGDTNLADGVIQGSSPAFTLTPHPLDGADAKYAGRFAQVLDGTLQVPCYLTAGCGPGSHFTLASNGTPEQHGTYTARFLCVVPSTATSGAPARVALYGHGLLGSEREVLTNPDLPKMASEANMVFCAAPWIGMSSEDVPNAVGVLQDFSKMPTIADRLQQGFVDDLLLARLMAHPAGLVTSPLLHGADGGPIVAAGHVFYDGNSQGGINGGALTALSPDFTRAVLGVPGMNYSVLLPRSSDFDAYSSVMYPAYPDQLERPLLLDLAQLLWDRGEADGYAQHMTTDPLPNTPRHTVLLDVAFGDHQVTPFQADVEARTIGASIRTPILGAGRSPQRKPSWGIPAIKAFPFAGSAIEYWDGPGRVAVPPLANTPNRALADPHEDVRRTPAARAQKSAFLMPNGGLVDVCGAGPCLTAPDVG